MRPASAGSRDRSARGQLSTAALYAPFDLEAEEDGCVMVTISNLVSGG